MAQLKPPPGTLWTDLKDGFRCAARTPMILGAAQQQQLEHSTLGALPHAKRARSLLLFRTVASAAPLVSLPASQDSKLHCPMKLQLARVGWSAEGPQRVEWDLPDSDPRRGTRIHAQHEAQNARQSTPHLFPRIMHTPTGGQLPADAAASGAGPSLCAC